MRVVARLSDDDPWRQQLRERQVRKDRAALERLAEAERVLAQPPGNLTLLSRALIEVKGRAAAVRQLRRAQQRHPADFWINFVLAGCLRDKPATNAETIGFYRVALALRPHSPAVYNNLGNALWYQKKLSDAEAACRKAIELQPGFAVAYANLGNVLRDQKKLVEAEAACRKAIELQPDLAGAYSDLGVAFLVQKKLSEAEARLCRRLLQSRPRLEGSEKTAGGRGGLPPGHRTPAGLRRSVLQSGSRTPRARAVWRCSRRTKAGPPVGFPEPGLALSLGAVGASGRATRRARCQAAATIEGRDEDCQCRGGRRDRLAVPAIQNAECCRPPLL